MKKYFCKSKVYFKGTASNLCEYSCVVEAEFMPRACLLSAVWEVWEEVTEPQSLPIEPTDPIPDGQETPMP